MATPIILGGRSYRAVAGSTIEHDVFFMARVRATGLDAMPKLDTESPEEYAFRLISALLASEKVLELIGALVLPVEIEDDKWTPDLAFETARTIGRLTAEADKATVRALVLDILLPFLESGLGSWMATRKSSLALVGDAEMKSPTASHESAIRSANGET